MAEEKTKKKKAGIVRQILKWFGLTVLSVLIILGLIFEAPWKVITLLLIVLAACRILPKPAIKWFWLSVGVIVIALIIWVFLPEDTEGWRPYTFDEELAAIETKRAIPDSENAATIYNELLETWEIDSNEPEFFCQGRPSSISEPWLSKNYPETAKWLRERAETIEKLIEITRIEKCIFPTVAGPFSFDQHIGRLPAMRRFTYLLASAANNDIAEGRTDGGLEKYLCIIQMAKHLYQQPSMTDFMVGFAIEGVALEQLNRFVIESQPSAEQLQFISNYITGLESNWSYDWPNILDFEKLYTKNTVCFLAYEINPKGKVRLSCRPTAAMKAQFPEAPALTYRQKKLYKTGTILGWFFMPSTPQKAAKIIDESFEKYYAMVKPDFDWQKEPREFSMTSFTPLFSMRAKLNYRYYIEHLADISESLYYGFHNIYLRHLTLRRGSRLLVAIRQYKLKHNAWPASLDPIRSQAPSEVFIDPQNGGAFVYKLTEENFILYSKGKNNIDEDGQYNTKWAPDYSWYKVEEDDIPIWSPRNSKAKEENSDAEQQ